MYERLQRLATKRYGPRWDSFSKTLHDVLRCVWCPETARPDMAANWQPDQPAFGQDDVTAYFLAKYILGGRIILFNVIRGNSRYAVLASNGEGASIEDYCYNWEKGISDLEVVLTTEEFIAGERLLEHSLPDLQIDRRVKLFFDRFEAALRALEQEAR